MKRPEEIKYELVRQWLSKADKDFQLAKYLLDQNLFFEAVGFHCQQAVEKYLKAFLIKHEVDFPRTHFLGTLLDLVASVNPGLAKLLV